MNNLKIKLLGIVAGGCAILLAGCGGGDGDREPVAQNSEQRQDAGTGNEQNRPMRVADEGPVEVALHEEELHVDKREVPAGGVVISKDVETDTEEASVQLRHETVEVTRVSPEEARQLQQQAGDQASSGEAFQEGEVFIPLSREEAVPRRETQVREVVRAERGMDSSVQEVEEEVRREVVDYEDRSREEVAQQRQGQQETQREVAATPGDGSDELRRRIEQELANALPQDQLDLIEVRVDQREVEVAGVVPSEDTAQQVENHIREVDGVEEVHNYLQVAQR